MRNVFKLKVLSKPDAEGRSRFRLDWWDDYFPGHPEGEHKRRLRGQYYYADLNWYREHLRLEECNV